jgi:archaellum component FlaD/FlaE
MGMPHRKGTRMRLRPEEEDEEEGDGDVTMRAGDLEIEVEGGQEEEQKGEKVVQDTHMDQSGETGDQEAQADEEAQPEEPVEEEVEEAPRRLNYSEVGAELTFQHHPPYQYSRSARTRPIPLHLPRLL